MAEFGIYFLSRHFINKTNLTGLILILVLSTADLYTTMDVGKILQKN